MAKKNPFKYSVNQRNKIIKDQTREIKSIYLDGYKAAKNTFGFMKTKGVSYDSLNSLYTKVMEREMTSIINTIDTKVERSISNNVDKMVSVVLQNNQQYLTGLGYKDIINTREMRLQAVNNILSGNLYQGYDISLSKSIWGDNARKIKEIEKIISRGMLEEWDVGKIAKKLQDYVNPNMINKIKVPGIRGKVDYNALRLARTTIQHAYQKAFIDSTYLNPFIDAYRWVTAGTGNVCGLCIERATTDQYGLGDGIFPKDSVPLDHPNGQCTLELVVTMSDDEIKDAIADWYLGVGDETMNRKLDEFAKSLK